MSLPHRMRKVGKLYVPSKSLTPLDRVREALAEAEQVLSNMRGAGPEAVQLLHLLVIWRPSTRKT
jgi:hypothetical protein